MEEEMGHPTPSFIFSINQSNVFIKPFLHQQMSQRTLQKPILKLQTASNAGVEQRCLRKNKKKSQNLGRNQERNQALRGGQSSPGCAGQ